MHFMAVKSVHLPQLKGIQSSKLGSQRGIIYFVNRGYTKRYLFNFVNDLPRPPPPTGIGLQTGFRCIAKSAWYFIPGQSG